MTAFNIKSAARALGGNISGRNRILCPGPGHGKRDRSLSVTFSDDGSFAVHSFACDDWRECKDHVRALLGFGRFEPQAGNDNRPTFSTAALLADALDEARRTERALGFWREAVPIEGTLAAAYLANRGLAYSGTALRFHASCPFRQERHPAMLGLMVDIVTNVPRGIHRTALLPDGTGKAAPGKMMLGVAAGACVKLTDDADVAEGLGIAEGIETALATGYAPVWACLSAGTMRDFPVLGGIEALTIFADSDRTGIEAANDCGRRWHEAGREVTIAEPIEPGADFADLVKEAA
ncbi:toprim domain-containing protein [Mesorhizobium sp. AaZ16]|uniref:DUF7146 domain-containing protein n=1 Tax=Mesorhizobium sp. AaZ16 TaxID=3402289 RepID=UPI00374EB806